MGLCIIRSLWPLVSCPYWPSSLATTIPSYPCCQTVKKCKPTRHSDITSIWRFVDHQIVSGDVLQADPATGGLTGQNDSTTRADLWSNTIVHARRGVSLRPLPALHSWRCSICVDRLVLGLMFALFVWSLPVMKTPGGHFPVYFYVLLFFSSALHQVVTKLCCCFCTITFAAVKYHTELCCMAIIVRTLINELTQCICWQTKCCVVNSTLCKVNSVLNA